VSTRKFKDFRAAIRATHRTGRFRREYDAAMRLVSSVIAARGKR